VPQNTDHAGDYKKMKSTRINVFIMLCPYKVVNSSKPGAGSWIMDWTNTASCRDRKGSQLSCRKRNDAQGAIILHPPFMVRGSEWLWMMVSFISRRRFSFKFLKNKWINTVIKKICWNNIFLFVMVQNHNIY
jgi:hypothetical protein